MSNKVKCSSCGWSWNKSDSSTKDMYVCHECGKNNTMQEGGFLDKISAKNWIDPKEFARSKGIAKSDSPTKRVVDQKVTAYEKPTASISPYNPGLKLSSAQQAKLEKNLKNRKMLENVQLGLGAAEALGAFPHPVTEGLGFGAGLLNAGLSSYLAGEDYSAGNYGGMAGNLLGAGLSGVGAAALAPKKVTDVVNTAAKSKNLKELGAYALGGVPPEKAVGRIGKGDLKAMRQVQEIRRKTPNEYETYLQSALDENIPDIHFEKAFGKTKDEAKQIIQDRAADRAAYEQLVAQRQTQEVQRTADLQAANTGNVQTQAAEDIDVNDIDWSQFDESNDNMSAMSGDDDIDNLYDVTDDNAYSIEGGGIPNMSNNQMPPPPSVIYTDTTPRIDSYRINDSYVEDTNGVLRNNYGETVAEESARLDNDYAQYLAQEQGYGNYNPGQQPGVVSQLAGGQFRDAKNQLGEVVQEVGANPNAAMREVKEAVTNSTGENKLKNKAIELLQDYPYYGGNDIHSTNPMEYLSQIGSKKGFAERVNQSINTADQIPSGQVFTGSTNTSHNSYLPQLKTIFKEGVKEGDPTFLGYKRMNDSGYLSQGSYSPEEIAAYLNTEIDEQIKRKIVPKNIQRPYVKNDDILLPHYGIKKKEDGGWLQKYNDGGPIQPNYNDYSVSAGEGFQGDGYSNVGRNYSPAWGGQFAMGGSIGGATQGIPGATGFMYARTGSIPSNGKYAKKTKASAENGTEMQFYQEGLDWKPKSMADGGVMDGFLDPIVNAGKSAVNYVDNLVKTGINKLSTLDEPDPNIAIAIADAKSKRMKEEFMKKREAMYPKSAYNKLIELNLHHPKTVKLDKQLNRTEWNKEGYDIGYATDKNRIKLNTGRFTGANVSSRLIDDIAEAAKRNNIPIGQLLTLAGRESTFGEEKGKYFKYENKNIYTSGWDVADDYRPYDVHRFLADKKVPGVSVEKSSRGYTYDFSDPEKAKKYMNSHPELLQEYKKKLDSTPDIGNKNFFDLSAEFLKKKGIKRYNPGDPKYVSMFQKDYDTLKQDKALMAYLKKKGYKYEDGGELTKLDQLTNFTNYNTKQPGGWLDKYQ